MMETKHHPNLAKVSRSESPWVSYAVLGMALVAFLLRVYRLDFFSLRGDEAFTVIFVQRTWEGLWRGISFIEPNPPLMYLLLRVWVALAGASEFTTRYCSVFFGVLCIPLLYRLAREMNPSSWQKDGAISKSTWTALFAAALIAINPYQIWHSQDVRNYTMWPALSLASLIFFWRWWRLESWQTPAIRPRTLSNLAIYTFFALASLYTHYYDVFILAAENIFVFAFAVSARRWRTLGHWVGAQVMLVLAYAPWVLFGTNRISTYGEASAESGVSLLDAFSRTIATFTLSDTLRADWRAMLWIPLAIGLILILTLWAQTNRSQTAFLILYIAVPTMMLYFLSIGRPLFNERYLNGIAPAYYLAFAVGLVALWPPHSSWHLPAFYGTIMFFSVASAYALANYWYNPLFAKAPDWRGLAQQINSNLREGDIIVQNFNEVSVQYYRRGNTPVITLPRDYWFRPEDVTSLQRLNKDYRRIWFIPAQPDWWDPDQNVEMYLLRYDDREEEIPISVFHLQLYVTPREFESRMTPVNARVGAAMLVGYRAQKNANGLRVVLYWRVTQKSEKSFQVFVHLVDASGRMIAQDDSVPVEGTYPTSEWQVGEWVVDSHNVKIATAGAFTLYAGMYDSATNERVSAFDANGTRLIDDRVILTQIAIP